MLKKVLNVGGNSKAISLPDQYAGWEQYLLDIDPTGNPDIVCDARELTTLAADQYDAIYCSHNLERYFHHDVAKVLAGLSHVLKPAGHVYICVSDVGELMRRAVLESLDLDDTLYQSGLGPISVRDVIYGYGPKIESGEEGKFAHKTGFTRKTLIEVLAGCGFGFAYMKSLGIELGVFAFKRSPTEAEMRELGLSALPVEGKFVDVAALRNISSLSLTELIAQAEKLAAMSRIAEAIELYRSWIGATDSPFAYAVRFNLGRLLSDSGDLPGALESYTAALAQNPTFAMARLNLGNVLEQLGRRPEAIAEWQRALSDLENAPTKDPAMQKHALNSLGRLLEVERRFPEAEAMLTRSLLISPDQEDVLHHWVPLRQRQCEWPVFSPLPGLPADALERSTSAFAMLSAADDPALQLEAARKYVRSKVRTDLLQLAPKNGYGHERIRIGFMSSDLCLHAVSQLTVELFELLDRSQFEVYGYCWSRQDGTQFQSRVVKSFDHYIRIAGIDDAAAASMILSHEIDVLVDLHGLTAGARMNVFSYKPAPVQITYLGFAGTTGHPSIDYIIADRYLIPEEEAPFYSETPLYLSEVYQCSDRQRPIAKLPTRAECGLPENTFVFCSHNNNYKFNEEVFACWMRILKSVPRSVLWLLEDNEWAKSNLCGAASRHSVSPERLIFAPRAAPPEYLSRFSVADLFLDTYPCNAGATANDVLWMGLPILTRSGRTFASRMAGSLLSSLGLPELITSNVSDYEKQAVFLATNPRLLADLKKRLTDARSTSPLFDMPRFVRHFEAAVKSKIAKPI